MERVWETKRWQEAVNVEPHTKRKVSPKDLVAFPWESRKRVHKAATYEEVQEALIKVFGK